MVPTGNSGIVYWRMQNFVQATWRNSLASFQNPLWVKDQNDPQEWENCLKEPGYKWPFIGMIQSGVKQADAIVVQLVHTPDALRLFRAIKDMCPNKPVLCEIDDHMLSVAEYNPAYEAYWPGSPYREIAITQMREADGLIVSTPYLKEVYSEFNANIWVVPNCIDFKAWDRVQRGRKGGIRIGWAGGASHEEDVRSVLPAIKGILAKHRDVRFVFVNGPAKAGLPDWLKGVPRVEHIAKWSRIDKYPQALASHDFDIGIAPLVDNAFNRGKSNLRWLEYSALGIPCVASNVGHFAETLKDGQDVFLADDAAQFEAKLELLIKDRKLRLQMGTNANQRIRKDFNVDLVAAQYVEHLKAACALKQPKEALA